MKKQITGSIPEAATHAEIIWYKSNENACSCNLLIIDGETESTIVNGRIYRIDNLPFELTTQELAYLTGSKPDETWPEDLAQEFLDKNDLEEIPEGWINSYDPGHAQTTTEKLKSLDIEKTKRLEAGFTVNDILFDSDTKAEMRYMQLATKFQSDPTYIQRWKAANNTWVDIDATLFSQIIAAFEVHVAGVYTWLEIEQAKLDV